MLVNEKLRDVNKSNNIRKKGFVIFRNPILITIISVVLSLLIYFLLNILFALKTDLRGYLMSSIIPILVAYPVSSIVNKYLKKTEEQKRELERLDLTNKKLFSIISHDIRSPIASLNNMVELMLDDSIEVEASKVYLNDISKNINQVLDFLNDLLIWSKNQIENKPVEKVLFNSNDSIEVTIRLFQSALMVKKIKLIKGSVDTQIFCDKEMYSFVFRNILHNAIKFTPENGVIEIYTKEIDNKIQTVVRDTGIGISESEMNLVFDSKKWYTKSGTGNEAGTGFGISTCADYLKQNNGNLLIESKVGVGTKAIIELPMN